MTTGRARGHAVARGRRGRHRPVWTGAAHRGVGEIARPPTVREPVPGPVSGARARNRSLGVGVAARTVPRRGRSMGVGVARRWADHPTRPERRRRGGRRSAAARRRARPDRAAATPGSAAGRRPRPGVPVRGRGRILGCVAGSNCAGELRRSATESSCQTVGLSDLLARAATGPAGSLSVPLGVDRSGAVLVDLVSQGPHALVAGTTGSVRSNSWSPGSPRRAELPGV